MGRGRRGWDILHLGRWAALLALVVGVANAGFAQPAGVDAPSTAPALTVGSEPEGATVFLDGKRIGVTPVSVGRLAIGDHDVKVVKKGYLENRRVVSVVDGSVSRVEVVLTRVSNASDPDAEPEASEGEAQGHGSKKKWLIIGVGAVAAGAGTYLAVRSSNDPPTVADVTVEPAGVVALASATQLTFAVQASDPNGDALSYTWDFGDGSSGTGASVTHVYASEGTYSVTVSASDGKASATGSASVDVRSVAGLWRGTVLGFGFTLNLHQSGTNLTGTWAFGEFASTLAVSGKVTAPRNISLRAGNACERIQGVVSDDAQSIAGRLGCGPDPVVVFDATRK